MRTAPEEVVHHAFRVLVIGFGTVRYVHVYAPDARTAEANVKATHGRVIVSARRLVN